MTVQHILDPDRPYPLDSPQVQPFLPTPPLAAAAATAPTAKQPPSGPKGKQAAQAAVPQGSKAKAGTTAPTSATPSGKPPGLKLLARMSKPGQAGVPGPKTQAGYVCPPINQNRTL